MAEIDSLEIVIQDTIKDVNKNLDALIGKLGTVAKGLSAIRTGKGFGEFIKQAENISASMNKVSDSAKNVSKQISNSMNGASKSMGGVEKTTEKVKKSLNDIIREISDKTINISPNLNMENVSGEIKKYENQLRSSQNALNRILASDTADKQVKGIERLVIRINEAQNALKQLKSDSAGTKDFYPYKYDGVGYKNIDDFMIAKQAAEGVKTSIEGLGDTAERVGKEVTNVWNGVKIPEELKQNIQDANSQISEFEKTLANIQPLNFSGNFYEMEKWVNDLQLSLEKLYTKQERLNDLGVKPDSRGMKNLALDIEQITKTLDVYEKKLEEARQAGKLEIKIPSIDAPVDKIISKTKILKDNLANMKINISSNSLQEVERQIEKIKQAYVNLVEKMGRKADITPFYGATQDFKNKMAELSALRQRYQDLINKQKELSVSGADAARQFKEKLGALVIPEIKITDPKKLQNHLTKLEADLDKFKAKLQNDITMGRIVVDDKGYQKALEQIALTEKSIEATKKKMGEVGTGNGGNIGRSMSKGASASELLAKALQNVSKQISNVISNISKFVKTGLRNFAKGIKTAVSNVKKLIGSFGKLISANKKSNASFSGGLKSILKYAFGIRSLFVLFNRIIRGFGEGIKNLVQFSDSVNHSVSLMTSALGALKNSFAVAFAPIVNVVAPYITKFVNMMTDAFNAVGRFFAALTGKKITAQATKYYKDYAASIGGVTDAAKDASKALHTLGIDELNILSENKDNGAGAGDIGIEDMFTDVPIEGAIADWAKRIRDAFLAGEWEELGKVLAELVNAGLQKVYDAIKDITPKVEQALKNFAKVFNSFVEWLDWDLLGRTIGAGINLIVKAFNALFGDEGINLELLGQKLSVGLRGMIDEAEWKELGNALGNGFMISWRILDGFISDMARKSDAGLTGWAELGIALGNAVNGIFERINFEQIARVITGGFHGVIETISKFFGTIEWENIADKLNKGVRILYDGIKWNSVIEKVTEFTDNFSNAINTLANDIDWNMIGRTIGAEIDTIVKTMNQLIEKIDFVNIGKQFANGIMGIVDAVDWKELGNLIGNKLMIIPNIIYGFVTNFDFGKIGVALGNALNGIVEKVDFGVIGSTLGKAINGLFQIAIDFSSTFDWKELGENIANGINNLFKEFDPGKAVEGCIALIGGFLDTLIEVVENTDWEEVANKILDFMFDPRWYSLTGKVLELAWALVKGLAKGLWDAITSITWGDIWDWILKCFKNLFGIHSPSTVMYEQGGFLMQGLINGIRAFIENVVNTFKEIKNKIVEAWSDVKKVFQDKWNEITKWWRDSAISKWWENDVAPWFTKEKWSELYNSIKTTLKSKWDETVEQWEIGIRDWWDTKVKPWFKPEKWSGLYNSIKEKLISKWNETVGEWTKNIRDWWDTKVKPWFTKEKWGELYNTMKTSLQEKWGNLVDWWKSSAISKWWENDVAPWFTKEKWNFGGIKEGLEKAWKSAVEGVKNIWNTFAEWLNDKLKFEIPPINIMGVQLFGGATIDLGKIPTYSVGGFPEDGLFMANHTELVGQFSNGRTAVANNEQIIAGIEEAAYRGFLRAQAETSPYLADIAENTRRTAEKDMSVKIGDRDIVDSYRRGSTRMGWEF